MTIPYTPEQIVTVLETQDITVISPPTHGETVSGAYTVELTGITTPPRRIPCIPGGEHRVSDAEESDRLDAAGAIQVIVATLYYNVGVIAAQWTMGCEANPHSPFVVNYS